MNYALRQKLEPVAGNRDKPRLALKLVPEPEPTPPCCFRRWAPGSSERVQDWLARCRDAGLLQPWPEVLPTVRGIPMKPLKIGAGAELLARVNLRVMGRKRFHRWMHALVTAPEYRCVLALPESWRHDLDGQPVEPVSERDRRTAWAPRAASGRAS